MKAASSPSSMFISIFLSNFNDTLLWKQSKDGQYLTKSGYYLATSSQSEPVDATSTSSYDNDSGWWIKLWKTRTLLKVKSFAWWARTESLQTRDQLERRIRPIDKTCARCGLKNEITVHLLKDCKWPASIWLLCTPVIYSCQNFLTKDAEFKQILGWRNNELVCHHRYGKLETL